MEWSEETAPKGLDLPRLYSATLAHKRWIIVPTLVGFFCAVGLVTLVKPRYTATAKVLLENGESYYTRPEKEQPDPTAIIDDMTVQSEAEAAKTPEVERRALAMLKPEDSADISSGGLLASLMGGGGDDDPDGRRLAAFDQRIQIYPQAKTRVLLFEFTSAKRSSAAAGANALAQAFLESQQIAKDTEAKVASGWLSQQIDALRTKVAAAEGRVEALRAKSGLLTGTNGLEVPSQQLSEIATQIATARAAATAASSKAAALKEMVRAGRLDEIGSVANDESLRRYAESRVALKAQIAELGRTLLPGHPRMKELSGQLAELEQQIRAAATKRVLGFEEESQIAASQVKSLQQAVASQANAVSSNDADQVKLRELEIDAKTARDQLESYLTKYREAISRDAENAVPANGRIIARALAPLNASFPKTGPTLLLAPLAALFVSLGLVVAKILLTDGAATASLASARPAPPAERTEPKLPFGIDPPLGDAAASEEDWKDEEARRAHEERLAQEDERAQDDLRAQDNLRAWTSAVETFADRLAETAEGDSLPLMVAAETGALPAALVAARRLTQSGHSALVDLGPSPSWLSDLFDPEFGPNEARRDLSTPLDIFPSLDAEVSEADIGDLLAKLAQRYAFIVVHAPDWRAPAARRAAEDMAALLLVAPSAEIGAMEAHARAAYRDEGLAIKAIAMDERIGGRMRAA